MSREALWERVRMAWSMLASRVEHEVHAGRPRERALDVGEGPIAAEGFAEEALPWLDAVFRFALRLTRGDRDAADDLTQETFLRAHRFWDTYELGTNTKSWLFTICRNAFLREKDLLRSRTERPASDIDARLEAVTAVSAFHRVPSDPETEFFGRLIDDEVVDAIDALPEEFRETLVLSDLGDLKYAEISDVLDIPIGTVRSRLFRARRILQERLREFAVEAGYLADSSPSGDP